MKKKEGVKRGPGRPRKYPVKEKPVSDGPKTRKPTRVKPKISKFDEIMKIADNELKNFLRTLDPEIIFASLQGADEAVKDKVLSNITKRSLLQYEILIDTNPEKFDEKQVMSARRKMIKPFKR